MSSLQPGTKLGPYELLSPIGAGGMGEVWKARDTRLGRIVAIKKGPPGRMRLVHITTAIPIHFRIVYLRSI